MPLLRFFASLVVFPTLCAAPAVAGKDWPHWRGPERNGITAEQSGWNPETPQAWAAGEPRWRINAGEGASSPLVWNGRVYCLGWRSDEDMVSCLDLATGKPFWSQHYASPKYGRHASGDQRMYHGATSTPELDPDTGLLFTLSCDGELIAWDITDAGRPAWRQNLYDDYAISRRPQITKRKSSQRDYGYTTAPFVHGDWVIVETGATSHGNLIAFDKRTGREAWASESRDPAGHSGGPAPITVDGIPCLAVATAWGLHVARIDGSEAGRTVAEFEWKTDFCNTIAGIAVSGQDIVISSRYNQMAMARLTIDLEKGVREVWRNRYPTGVCAPVIHDGKIYFANKGVFCVDFESGRLDWAGGKIGDAGSCLVTGDDRLVVWGNGGDLSLFETARRAPEKCAHLAERSRVFDDMAWPHVVLAEGHLLVKTLNGDLACFPVPPPDAAD